MVNLNPPEYPAGKFELDEAQCKAQRAESIEGIRVSPKVLRELVSDLSGTQLDLKYRNWTVRQIVHHLADSQMNAFIRVRLALTEDHPTIKPYDETKWSQLDDSRMAKLSTSLEILAGVHTRWALMLERLDEASFARTFYHPESKRNSTVDRANAMYVWHMRHHTAQIEWIKANRL
jgi:DinB superfamily